MLNTDDFVKRLELVFEYYGLSGASFADKIGIQRSSLSHLLSGRNKPSLEFVMKIVSVLPEVDFGWILNGDGEFPKSSLIKKTVLVDAKFETPTLFNTDIPEKEKADTNYELDKETTIVSDLIEIPNQIKNTSEKSISQIVIFYKDGTFSDYKSN